MHRRGLPSTSLNYSKQRLDTTELLDISNTSVATRCLGNSVSSDTLDWFPDKLSGLLD